MLSFLGNSKPSETSASASSSTSTSTSSTLDSSSLPSLSTSLVETKTPSSSILSAPYSALSSVAKTASDAVKSASDAAKSATASVGASVGESVSSVVSSAKSATETAAKTASEAAKSASLSSSSSSLVSESSSSSSLFSFDFDMWTVLRYFGIVLILSFLGINLFGNLGKFTETVRDMLKPLLVILGIGAAETVKTTVNLGAAGTDVAAKGADVAAKTVTSGINILEKGISKKGGAKINKIDDNSKIDMNLLNNAVNKQNKNTDDYEPEPDEAGSRTQSSKAKLKSGFCYIGEDRGFRRCIKVGEGDKCMSGDIFPTDEICVNPSLRE